MGAGNVAVGASEVVGVVEVVGAGAVVVVGAGVVVVVAGKGVEQFVSVVDVHAVKRCLSGPQTVQLRTSIVPLPGQ